MEPLCWGVGTVGVLEGGVIGGVGEQHLPVLGGLADVRVHNIPLNNLGYLCCLVSPQHICCPSCCLPAYIVPWYEQHAGGDVPHLLVGQQPLVDLYVGHVA